MTTAVAIAAHATPAPAITAPIVHRLRVIAYHTPKPATTNGISSLQAAAATAHRPNGSSRSSSRNQKAKSRSGVASATGWNSLSVNQPVAGYRRYAMANATAAGADESGLRASQ